MQPTASRALSLIAAVALAVALTVELGACVHRVDDGREDNAALFLADGDVAAHLGADDDAGWMRTPAIAVNDNASRIGVRFDASGPFAVEARVSFDGGAHFSAWKKTTTTFSEEIAHNAFADVDDEIAAHHAQPTHVQVRFLAPVEAGLTFVAVDAFVPVAESASSSSSSQALAADGIAVTRDQWGARAANGCSTTQTPQKITIHHTESPNNDTLSMPARLRQLQNYAMDVRGFCDIGFHFLIGQDGLVYQGRNETLQGAHAANENPNNLGLAFVGTFSSTTPSSAMLTAAAKIMGSVSATYGTTLSSSTVQGHRDINNTDCPGDSLYAQLSSLISAAKQFANTTIPPTNPSTNPPSSSSSGVYAGLAQGSAVIPHDGISNPTLQNALGVSTEPYGTVVTAVNGQQFVQGKVSWFGGPNDTGVTSTETGSVAGDRLRGLNTPTNADASTIASRPQDFYYCAMRWDYSPGKTFWKNARILLVNPDNGIAVVVRPEDWGPNTSTGRIVDISPQAMKDLGTDTDQQLLVSFAAADTPLGVVDLSAQQPPTTTTNPPANPTAQSLVIPAGASWQWQLTGSIDTSVDASVYDIDLFDAPTSTIASLKAAGRRVICYFSAGTYESWRPDASQIPSSARGNALSAPFNNEQWLDTRSSDVRNVMKSRLDLAVQKGCDGVEPDNVDGYANSSGFSLSASTQLDFNRFLASEAHARNLSVGLKNDTDQLADLVDNFDWALNEQCYDYDECAGYASTFIAAGKAVLNAEYDSVDQLSSICAVTKPLGLSTILKNQMLDAPRTVCP